MLHKLFMAVVVLVGLAAAIFLLLAGAVAMEELRGSGKPGQSVKSW